jgi:hypothetical protein
MTTASIQDGQWRPPDPPRPRRSRGLGLPLAVLAVILLVTAACSGGAAPSGVATLVDPSASPDASPSASVDPEAAMQAFATCMREHGVNLQISSVGDDGGGGVTGPSKNVSGGSGRPTDKGEFAAAETACKHLLPQGGVNGPGGEIDPEFQDKLLAFAKCMREHGIDMPDPQFGSGGNTVTIGGPDDGTDGGPKLDPESKAFQDAQAACGSLLPGKMGDPATSGAGAGPVQVKP